MLKLTLLISCIFCKTSQMIGSTRFTKAQNCLGPTFFPGCSATGMGQFPICKLKRDLFRTSITACTINKVTFSAPFGIFYVKTEIWKEFQSCHYPGCSATGMGQFPICKLKWDLFMTSITACTIDKNTFSAPFGIFYARTEIWKEIFQKESYTNP